MSAGAGDRLPQVVLWPWVSEQQLKAMLGSEWWMKAENRHLWGLPKIPHWYFKRHLLFYLGKGVGQGMETSNWDRNVNEILFIYLFILFIWLGQVLVAAGGLLSCGWRAP